MSYELYPSITVKNNQFKILNELEITAKLTESAVIGIDIYPGVDIEKVEKYLQANFPGRKLINLDQQIIDQSKVDQVITEMGTDPIFSQMQKCRINQFKSEQSCAELNVQLTDADNVIIYGTCVSVLTINLDCYLNLACERWKIELSYRQGLANWRQVNYNQTNTEKFKFGYFLDWRLGDQIKLDNINNYDLLIDCTDQISGVSAADFQVAIDEVCSQPFRLKPFFDPGVWGGQWMKEKFKLDRANVNYAWSFDGVPEENAVIIKQGENTFTIPGIDLVRFAPEKLLGTEIYNRYGAEFPIRFDLLDTIDGQNLSLQVHPTQAYMQANFKLNYTQEESYYILDTKGDDAHVYLGLKNGVTTEMFFSALEASIGAGTDFCVEAYVNKISCKKGDHFLIPAGTIHCSGKDVMVLEISQTPYIFTFKLWDLARLDLNGKPRVINVNHGKAVVNENYNTDFVYQHLYNHFEQIDEDTIKTGLFESQDINSYKITTTKSKQFTLNERFHMLNVTDGEYLIISSPDQSFDDFKLNQYETLIIPASVKSYIAKPCQQGVTYVQVTCK